MLPMLTQARHKPVPHGNKIFLIFSLFSSTRPCDPLEFKLVHSALLMSIVPRPLDGKRRLAVLVSLFM